MQTTPGYASARGAAVSAADRACISWPDPDYIDAHSLPAEGAQRWPAEAWARAMFEDARPLRRRARLGLLGLLLSAPQPPGHVADWTIAEAAPDRVRLQSEGRFQRDQVVVRVEPARVTLVTAVRYRHLLAPVLWTLVSTQHRRFAAVVLTRARARLSAGAGTGQAPPAPGAAAGSR